MPFSGATFDNQIVKAKYDGALYNTVFDDGVLWGCEISTTANTVNIEPGMLICSGRVIPNEGGHSINVPSPTDGYMRVILQIDLDGEATTATFNQLSIILDYSTTPAFPALTREDINGDNNAKIYQAELGVFTVASGQIDGTVRTIGAAQPLGNAAMPKSGGSFTGLVYMPNINFPAVTSAPWPVMGTRVQNSSAAAVSTCYILMRRK